MYNIKVHITHVNNQYAEITTNTSSFTRTSSMISNNCENNSISINVNNNNNNNNNKKKNNKTAFV
jgi:hypothetical protein